MRRLVAVAVLGVAGCATTPAEIRALGPIIARPVSTTAEATGKCVLRTAQDRGLPASMRSGNNGAVEVLVYGGDSILLAVIESVPSARGAQINAYVSNNVLTQEKFAMNVTEGC